MLVLLTQGYFALFLLIIISIVISLTFHEYGHAITAKYFGDNTAQQAGRLTLNPIAHIDPLGLLMVVLIGFGFAKPVPVNPRNYNSFWADFFVSAAGPGMNLLLAVVAINFYYFGLHMGWGFIATEAAELFFVYFALINMLLMIFNLLPIGPLDGHYILPYFLPRKAAQNYRHYNALYGHYFLLALVVLSLAGVPIFQHIWSLGEFLLGFVIFLK